MFESCQENLFLYVFFLVRIFVTRVSQRSSQTFNIDTKNNNKDIFSSNLGLCELSVPDRRTAFDFVVQRHIVLATCVWIGLLFLSCCDYANAFLTLLSYRNYTPFTNLFEISQIEY